MSRRQYLSMGFGTRNPSQAAKLGSVWTYYRPVGTTCPPTCPLLGAGCYAQSGHVALHRSRALTERFDAERWLTDLPRNALVRHLESGDVKAPNDDPAAPPVVDTGLVAALVAGHQRRPDLIGWGYTHMHPHLPAEAVNRPGLTFNASCHNDAEVAACLVAGWPVAVTIPSDQAPVTRKARWVEIACPYQTHGRQCSACLLCARPGRQSGGLPVVVAFYPDGPHTRVAGRTVAAQRKDA